MEERRRLFLTSDGSETPTGRGFAPFSFSRGALCDVSGAATPLDSRRRPSWRSIRSSAQDAASVCRSVPRGAIPWCPGKIRWIFPPARGAGPVYRCVPAGRMITGRAYTARELYREAAKDAAFYRKGGGGVTLSGERSCSSGRWRRKPCGCAGPIMSTPVSRPRPLPLGPICGRWPSTVTRCLWT